MIEISAKEMYEKLLASNIENATGNILFKLNGINVNINTTDIVGNCIQSWLKKWMITNNIFCSEPSNTQIFPDFYLSQDNTSNLLEVKAFNYNANPGFDIANFEAYCSSLEKHSYRLNADYIIFGYTMDTAGQISIKKVWLKKVWELAGKSARYALNTQVKKNVIYNIRPVSNFKYDKPSVFASKEEFLTALFLTLKAYRGDERAAEWKKNVIENYKSYYNEDLKF